MTKVIVQVGGNYEDSEGYHVYIDEYYGHGKYSGIHYSHSGDSVGFREYDKFGKSFDPDHADLATDLPQLDDVKNLVALEALSIVTGARRSAYGTPEDNFERIARFWQAYFENTGRGDVKVTAADISPLMRLMKEARLCETPNHRDSFVDLIGYTLTGAEINKVDPQKPA